MITFIGSFVLIVLAVASMAVGVVFRRAPIRGSCGGVAGGGCAACTGKCEAGDGTVKAAASREESLC
ncbi:MAG TPA: hypothetical protein VGB36_16545 [Gammaproteobacteria bacterium]